MLSSFFASGTLVLISVFWKRHWIKVFRNKGFIFLIKYIICNAFIWVLSKFFKRRLDICTTTETDNPVQYGLLSDTIEWKLEIPRPQSVNKNAIDEIYLYGVNEEDWIALRMTINSDGLMESFLFLKTEGKTYCLPQTPTLTYSSFDKLSFKSKGLVISCKTPFKKWRLAYNGLLRTCSENLAQDVHVKIGFTWTALSEAYDQAIDIPNEILAKTFSSIKWNSLLPDFKKLKRTIDGHSQAGHLCGSLIINGLEKEKILWGGRTRIYGERREDKSYLSSSIQLYTKNGIAIALNFQSVQGFIQNFQHGYVVRSSGHLLPIQYSDIVLESFSNCLQERTYIIKTDLEEFEVNFQSFGNKSRFRVESLVSGPKYVTIQKVSVNVGTSTGSGIITIEEERILDNNTVCNLPKRIPDYTGKCELVSLLSDSASQSVILSGGKGASLAKLRLISQLEKQRFLVPNGVVVTCEAHKIILKNDSVSNCIKNIEDIAWQRISGNLGQACDKTSRCVQNTKMPNILKMEIHRKLYSIFNKDTLFAVRSSALDEDSNGLSYAGQMESILAVKGIDEICKAVMKCWASQYELIAVEYKRQYGQFLNTPMAVVIQEMVDSDSAGVLFTCDPVTGNPASIVISANYGLGESVMSGSSDPDTIILKRNGDNKLSVGKVQPGKKNFKIVLNNESGTKQEELSPLEQKHACLNTNQILTLGKISLMIEDYFGCLQDIEWTFANNNIYILQCRSITSVNVESEIELMCERDGPVRTGNEPLTTANFGEVMPGCTTPLTYTSTLLCFNLAAMRHSNKRLGLKMPHVQNFGSVTVKGHILLNLIDSLYRSASKNKSKFNEAQCIAIFGKVLDDEEFREMSYERYARTPTGSGGLSQLFYLAYDVWKAKELYNESYRKYWDFEILTEKFESSEELYCEICSQLTKLEEATIAHLKCTARSAILNLTVLTILSKTLGDWTPEVYSTFSALMSSSSKLVESAEVPTDFQNLSNAIAELSDAKSWASTNTSEAIEWLETQPKLRQKFDDFFLKHGHRCWKEFDLHSIPWGTNPEEVISILQCSVLNGLSGNGKMKATRTIDNIFKNLSLPMKGLQKFIMKFALPRSVNSVADREASKSLVIKMVDAIRKSVNRLSEMMVQEGRLPYSRLIFFLQLDELGILLRNRSPILISRALRRKRLHQLMDELTLPSIIRGVKTFSEICNPEMKLINPQSHRAVQIFGTPCSKGVAKGRACVIRDLKDAKDIQTGDILITNSTDIGWTLYFPLISGIVTEIGGLISHGAVIAREYGLPGLVGAENATRAFKTGDVVVLDTNQGTLRKITV